MSNRVLKGGAGLKRALEKIAKSVKAGEVQVGFMAEATYPDGTPVAAVAFWNEYGVPTRNQPSRPYFRNMIAAESPTWADKVGKLAVATDYDIPRVLGLMGEDIKGALQQSINDLTSPPLAPSTIENKGFAKPLIETSHMLNSATYKVKV